MDPNAAASPRDINRSLFGIAMALSVASLLLRDVYGVRFAYDPLAFVWFTALLATAVSTLASVLFAARTRRVQPLYFGVVALSVQLLGFRKDMDGDLSSGVGAVLMLLLGAVVLVEAGALFRSDRAAVDE